MAKKVNKFADAMNEALMGRTEENIPMNPPEPAPETTPEPVVEPFNQYADKMPVITPEDDPAKDPAIVTEEEMDAIILAQKKKAEKAENGAKQVCISLSAANLKRIDVLSKLQNMNRSKYISTILEQYIASKEDDYQTFIKLFGK